MRWVLPVADTPKDCLTALLRGLGAPPYAVDRIVADAVSQGILATPVVPDTFYRDCTDDLVIAVATLERVEALAKDFEASGSPAIRGVAKKLREALGD